MRSTFYGFDIAAKGLFTAQRQMDLTAHNMSNADTVGYTRQRIVQSAIEPSKVGKWLHVASQYTGGGVRILSVDQIRDAFLDRQYRNENTRATYWDTRQGSLYYVESIFNDLDTEYNMGSLINKFFNSMQEISTTAPDYAVRTNVINSSKSMITTFHEYYDQLHDLMMQQDDMLVSLTIRINEIGSQIADLNESIVKFELGGYTANDLRDRRNLLLDELSGIVGISYAEIPCGAVSINGRELSMVEVRIGGDLFVDKADFYRMVAEPDDTIDNDIWLSEMMLKYSGDMSLVTDAEKLHTLRFADGPNAGADVKILDPLKSNGLLEAYLDLRDGKTVENQGIPYLKAQLDRLAAALVEEINAIHRQGWTIPYDGNPSVTGVDFFDPGGLTIDTIRLSDALLASPCNLALSDEEVEINPISGDFETGNNKIFLLLIKLKDANDIDSIGGGFGKFFNTFIAELASEVDHANQAAGQDRMLLASIEDQRMSVSAVSLDEEMTNLIRFQQAYNAAARVITTMDEALDVLINRTGRVGL